MRRSLLPPAPAAVLLVAVLLVGALGGCAPAGDGSGEPSVAVPGRDGATKTAATVRAERRLFDGAPPVTPHGPLGADCVSCHHSEGVAVEGLGFSPPSPHADTPGMGGADLDAGGTGALVHCEQCHVYANEVEPFSGNTFVGLRQDLRRGPRLNPLSPPVMPHGELMRENCQACHTGPAAREEIRTDHPERQFCRQCHVEPVTTDTSPFDSL